MPTTLRTLLVLSLVALAAAPLQAQRRSDIITAEEIARVIGKGRTAYDVVRTLRPRWLRPRELVWRGVASAPVTTERPHLYLLEVYQGDVDYLRTTPAELVAEL